ncbi:MAG: hypothetical protein HYX84_01030 [Chloroflexi bacterium]|nr:hypothetical protein [Chloroflexota bacterium]
MDMWLAREEASFEQKLFVPGAARAARSKNNYSILVRAVHILDNRRLFGASDVIVFTVVVDGYPDMKSKAPFWAQEFKFVDVKDGATLPIDADLGALIYRGKPRDFLNLYILVVRDMESTRRFADLLSKNLVAKGLGTLAGAAVSIFSGLPSTMTVPVVRDLTTQAVETTLDYFRQQKNVAIGTYYASLIKEKNDFGSGLHPPDYPSSLVNCGGALEIALEVKKETK